MLDHDVFFEQALLSEGRLDIADLEKARQTAADTGVDLTDALVNGGLLSGREVALAKASVSESPFINLDDFEPCYANTSLVPRSLAERYCLFPLFMIDGVLTLAMDDPLNLEAMDQVRQIVQCDVEAALCDRELLRALISRSYSLSDAGVQATAEEQASTGSHSLEASGPAIDAVNQLIQDAIEQQASDIHINPDEFELRIRYRVDGVLHVKQGPPLSMHASIVQRLKVMAMLDLTQTRRPQDGKVRVKHGGRMVEIRVSTAPTVCGENVVLRILAGSGAIHNFRELGIPDALVAQLERLIAQPYGMLFVTGPTGSGKTTTLYAALNRLNEPSRNIMTIEDPVEIRLPYVRQIQTHREIGLTFVTALRSILRQDPDVVLVGEVRDSETASIALQAALTGHLVLSTLHTNDACGAVARLRDFGLPSFVINTAVLGVMAQRLVRRVCTHCGSPASIDDILRERFGLSRDESGFVSGSGCAKCSQTGFRGRVGIYELLQFTPAVRSQVEQGGSVEGIRELAMGEGMQMMWQDGLEKARLGATTLEEVAKVAAVVDLAGNPGAAGETALRQSA